MIQRFILSDIMEHCHQGKAIIIIGARQVGKTTLLKELKSKMEGPVLWLDCDIPQVRSSLSNCNLAELKLLIGGNKTIIIDEAQRVNGIGLTLKIIIDNIEGVQVLVSGSSAFDLRNKLEEPLTGRKWEYYLYPISTEELYVNNGLIDVKQRFDSRLIYGSYPDVINGASDVRDLLTELTDSYLYKDILELHDVQKSGFLDKLLVALALQVGSEVSYNELSKTVGLDSKTVEKYINLLEKCYIIFTLNSFSRNIRTELTKSKKIYFYDNGVRNAIIQTFSTPDLRGDIGALWENFFISERLKYNHYHRRYVKSYFWRTTDKQEIDYIEEYDGKISLFEIKWNSKKQTTKFPNKFLNTYNPTSSVVVTPENYLEFLIKQR